MTQQQAPETTHGAVRNVINANATDAEARIGQLEVENTIKLPSDLGTPVGGFYELSEDGKYRFGCGLTLDFPIKLTKLNGNYTFEGVNINCLLTYAGVESMIQTTNTSIVLNVTNLVLNAPNTEAITFSNGNSLILNNVSLGFGCQKVATVTDCEFLTCNSFAMVGCGDGVTAVNIDTIRLTDTQWSDGADSSGTAFDISGTGARVIVNNLDYRAKTTESMFDIDSGYSGVVTMVGGAFTDDGGSFFKAGGKDETSVGVVVSSVADVDSSKAIGSFTVQTNIIPVDSETIIGDSGVYVDCNFDDSAVELDNTQRFTLMNSTTGEIRYDGSRKFSGSLFCPISAKGSGSASLYSFRVTVNGVSVKDANEDDITAQNQISGTFSSTALLVPLTLLNGDLVKIQVTNLQSTSNITLNPLTCSIQ